MAHDSLHGGQIGAAHEQQRRGRVAQVVEADLVHAKRPAHVPVVLTPAEAISLLAGSTGPTALVGPMLYGAGLRLLEALRLRVKDVDFERREIIVLRGRGAEGERASHAPRCRFVARGCMSRFDHPELPRAVQMERSTNAGVAAAGQGTAKQ